MPDEPSPAAVPSTDPRPRSVRTSLGGVRGTVLTVATAALILAALTWAVETGVVWRTAVRSGVLRYAPVEPGNMVPESVVRNYAIFTASHAGGPPAIYFVGSSCVGFGVDAGVVQAALAQRRSRREVYNVWVGGADTISVYLMTQHLPLKTGDVVVLGLSPHMTLFDPAHAEQSRQRAELYAHPRSPLPREHAPLGHHVLDRWSPYRFRTSLRLVANAAVRAMVRPAQPPRASATAPDEWLRIKQPVGFAQARRAYARTGDVAAYAQSYIYFPDGVEMLRDRQVRYSWGRWEPAGPMWTVLRGWVNLVRAQGGVPLVVLFPLNPIFRDIAIAAFVPGADGVDPSRALFDQAKVAQWQQDVRRVLESAGVPVWDDVDRFAPPAFYDLEHLLPAARTEYSTELAVRLAQSAAPPASRP